MDTVTHLSFSASLVSSLLFLAYLLWVLSHMKSLFCHKKVNSCLPRQEVLSYSRVEDLNKGVAFLFSLFLIDLDSLATSLVRTTVPNLIQADSSRLNLLVDPRGTALAKLCVMCTVALLKMTEMRKGWCGG